MVNETMAAMKYRDEILAPHVIPITQQHHLAFQLDNARPSVAKICTDFLAQNNMDVKAWPLYNPDFSLTEHLWDKQDRRIYRGVNIPVML